jgi:NAD(P)H dehydrogenase (quinone)
MSKVLVLYYSSYGHIEVMANAVAGGAREAAHTYLGADSRDEIALANEVAGRQPTKSAGCAPDNFKIPAAA